MFVRLRKFARLGPARQLLLLRIGIMLATVRLGLPRAGLSHYTAGLTLHRGAVDPGGISAGQLAQARELGELVALAARYAPWNSRCLTQVLVLQKLLEQRRIPGCFSLGVRRADGEHGNVLRAHAWLQCGDAVVSGAAEGRDYTRLSTFSWGTP